MKIAIIGSNSFDSLEFHLKDEFNDQGIDAKIFDFKKTIHPKIDLALNLFSEKLSEILSKKLITQIDEFDPQLIIGVYRHIHPNVVRHFKKRKIKIIHVNPDQLSTLQYQQIFVDPYDFYFTKDPFMVDFMEKKLDLNVFHYNEAFNPRIHKRPNIDDITLEEETGIDVLCFGSLYAYRNRMLHILKERGIDLKLYGHKARFFDDYLNDEFQNKAIFGKEKTKILCGSKIVFNNFHYAEIESVNNKFFEISGSGAFQICDYKEILNELLPIDPKLISYSSINEAENLIKFYLDKPAKRFEIRNTLYTYFLENHTYKNLVESILNRI
jgi:spore maturation protein CgeB